MTVLDLIRQYQSALARQDTAAMSRIIGVYRSMYSRITPQIQALADIISQGTYTVSQARRLRQFVALQEAITGELTDFAGYLKTDLQPLALTAAQMGEVDAFKTLRFIVGDRDLMRIQFDRISIESVYKILTFLDPKGALYSRLEKLAPFHAEQVSQSILDAVGMGINPRSTARLIMSASEQAFGGGLVDALRTARTAQLWGYREANRANYVANNDVVTGWIWVAELDDTTCLSCIAQNGTRHDLDESLDDHYNGRCASAPEVLGSNPIPDMQSGEDWFNTQSESTQKDMMGASKWQAWQDGKFDFSALSKQVEDDRFGHMRVVASLANLVGEQ
jgi:hypothetical protein